MRLSSLSLCVPKEVKLAPILGGITLYLLPTPRPKIHVMYVHGIVGKRVWWHLGPEKDMCALYLPGWLVSGFLETRYLCLALAVLELTL